MKNHRGYFSHWAQGKTKGMYCYYNWLKFMLKRKGETLWKDNSLKFTPENRHLATITLPEVSIRQLEAKEMDDYEAERVEAHYQDIHKDTVFNVMKGDGRDNPREVTGKQNLIFGGICYVSAPKQHLSPWLVSYNIGRKNKRSINGRFLVKKYQKYSPTLREAYDDLKEQYNIRLQEERFKNTILRPFEYYCNKFADI